MNILYRESKFNYFTFFTGGGGRGVDGGLEASDFFYKESKSIIFQGIFCTMNPNSIEAGMQG